MAFNDYYVRQLRDWKGAVVFEEMRLAGIEEFAELCGWTLARAHARSGDRNAIAGYLGTSSTFDEALVTFAERYAEQNQQDYEVLRAAITSGRVVASTDG